MSNTGKCVDDDNEEWGAYRHTDTETYQELKKECDGDDYCAGFVYSRMKDQPNRLYTTTECSANCERIDWSMNHALITGSYTKESDTWQHAKCWRKTSDKNHYKNMSSFFIYEIYLPLLKKMVIDKLF